MEIREITTSHKMSITISNQQSNITLNSQIAFVRNNKLYVEPFEHNGVLLNFSAKGILISMIAYEEEKSPYLWKIVQIDKEYVDGKIYHVISSEVKGVRINRRENFRVFLGISGTVTVVGQNKPFDVEIKDISENGFAVLIDTGSPNQLHKNEAIVLQFYDRIMEENFSLSARVVRIEKLEKYNLFGCRLLKENPMVSKYIANKQLENRLNSNKKENK